MHTFGMLPAYQHAVTVLPLFRHTRYYTLYYTLYYFRYVVTALIPSFALYGYLWVFVCMGIYIYMYLYAEYMYVCVHVYSNVHVSRCRRTHSFF